VTVRFIGGGNQNTRRKPPTCIKSWTNFIAYCCKQKEKKKEKKRKEKKKEQ
jgi:hypothetical protein